MPVRVNIITYMVICLSIYVVLFEYDSLSSLEVTFFFFWEAIDFDSYASL